MTNIFTLNKYDFLKGLVVAVGAAVVAWLAGVVNVPGFDLATLNWHELLRIAIAALVAYLAKNFGTTSEGKLLGAVKIEG